MMEMPKQAVILCGGLGTRLKPITNTTPKPMVSVNKRPFLEHLLRQVAGQGVCRFLLLTGYLGDQIRHYFGDGSLWGWKIEYSDGPADWDTGRRLWEAREKIDNRFLLLYSDNFVQFSLDRLLGLHQSKKALLSLLLAPKPNGNIRISSDGNVETYDKARLGHDLNFVDVGYMMIERDPVFEVLSSLENHPDTNFSEVLQSLAKMSQIAGLVVRDPYHSISDPERLELMRQYLMPKKILLIDRDGVINRKAPRGEYVTSWSEFKWVPDTRRAMKNLAAEGFRFIVITNQAGIARKMINPDDLEKIHHNMIRELAVEKIEILKVYVSHHHWDDHSFMRKPAPGMFFQAAKDFNLRMDQCVYIGDDERDCLAALNAGCGMIHVSNEDNPPLLEKYPSPYFLAKTLQDSFEKIKNFYFELGKNI